MLLENLTFVEVEAYLRSKDTVLLPVGSVEQHSEYGIIGTDFITAEAIARSVGEKLDLLVAPTVHYGVSPHHMAFAGSATLSPVTFIHMMVDILLSFSRHGFKRMFVINGHGGNRSGIDTAFQEVKMRGVEGQLVQLAWYDGLKETEAMDELFEGRDGNHATPSEISLTMLLRPDVFPEEAREPKEDEQDDFYWPLSAKEMRRVFPDGRMKAASWLASREKGRLVQNLAVGSLVEKISELRNLPLIGPRQGDSIDG